MTMQETVKYDLELYRGDSYGWRFKFWEDANRTVPTDISEATIESEIRDKHAGSIITPLTCQLYVAEDEVNAVDVVLSAEECHALPKKGVWDLEITFADGQVRTPIGGDVIITPDVTNST